MKKGRKMFVLPPDLICYSPFLSGLSPSLFSFLIFKFKGCGIVFIQNQTGIELLACLAGQAFEDGCPTDGQQVPEIVLCEQRATYFSENVEVAALVPALGDLGIDAHTLTATFWTVISGIGLLYLWRKGKELLADGADV